MLSERAGPCVSASDGGFDFGQGCCGRPWPAGADQHARDVVKTGRQITEFEDVDRRRARAVEIHLAGTIEIGRLRDDLKQPIDWQAAGDFST